MEYVPIGRPIGNTVVHIVDGHDQLQPIGVAGELLIGGVQVARGYLDREALTAERFVELEFDGVPGRYYRTGDLARWRSDGRLEYLGRIDDQVKLRGYRIELGEIEACLGSHEGVSHAAVGLYGEGDGKRLVGYVVPAAGGMDDGELKDHLRVRLPDYMVPSQFVALEALPLTPNGKLDRKALPEPGVIEGVAYVAARTQAERSLVAIWADVLGREPESISIHDNFFALGGDSILSIRVIAKARQAGLGLEARDIFEQQTLERLALAADTDSAPRVKDLPIARLPAEAPVPLSYGQQRLWFLSQLEGGSGAYNMPVALRLEGELDTDALRRSLCLVVERHEGLRQLFPTDTGGDAMVHLLAPYDPLEFVDLSDLPEGERSASLDARLAAQSDHVFDLEVGPLFRVELLRLCEREHVLLANMHHIVSDGWSHEVLIREFGEYYEAFAEGRVPRPERLPIQYGDYAAWQRGWLEGEVLEGQLGYWRAQLSGAPRLLELPSDRRRPEVQSYRGGHVSRCLSPELSERLKAAGEAQGATLYMVLLAAYSVLLSRYSGQEDICVGSPIAGRDHPQTEGLIGLFLNTLVMRVRLDEVASFSDLLNQVKETALGAYEHSDVPFEHLVDDLKPERSMAWNPLFQAMLALNNTPSTELKVGEVSVSAFEGKTGPWQV